jgi:hypothetical protein
VKPEEDEVALIVESANAPPFKLWLLWEESVQETSDL